MDSCECYIGIHCIYKMFGEKSQVFRCTEESNTIFINTFYIYDIYISYTLLGSFYVHDIRSIQRKITKIDNLIICFLYCTLKYHNERGQWPINSDPRIW